MTYLPKCKCYRVMPEYGSSGIWEFERDEVGPWRHSMARYDRLDLSPELQSRFKIWIDCYERQNLSGELNHVVFNAEGLSLAYSLFEHLEKQHYVEYQGELETGELDEPIDIGTL